MKLNERVPFVMWFNEGDPRSKAQLAMCVNCREDGARELIVYGPNDQKYKKYSVFHMSDPRLRDLPERRREAGGWDYTDDNKLLFELQERTSKLEASGGRKGG